MKKWLTIVCAVLTSLIVLTGCGAEQKDYKVEEFKTQAETYKNASQEVMQKMIAVKYETDSEDKVKNQEEYKKLAASLKYFANLKEATAPNEIQNDVKIVKEKANAMQAYFDSMIKSYVDAKGEQSPFIKSLSEIVRKSENKTLVQEFSNALVNITTPKSA